VKNKLLLVFVFTFFCFLYLGLNKVNKTFPKEITAPNFTLKNYNGKNISLNSFKGKIILLNFWASWCAYCEEEIPLINYLYKKYKNKNFVVLGINYGENLKTIQKYISKKKVAYMILADTQGLVAEKYEIVGLPTNILIDKNGKIVAYENVITKAFEKKLLKFLPK